MATTIYCDATECEAPADRIISDTGTGEQLAFCVEHFVVFCCSLADAATQEATEAATGPAPDPEAVAAVAGEQEVPAPPAPKSIRPPASAETNGADHAAETADARTAD